MTESQHKVFNKKPRWWPAIIICTVLLVIIFFTDQDFNLGSSEGDNHQKQVFKTIGTTVIGSFLLLLWALFFSRFSGITRLKIIGSLTLIISVFLTSLETNKGLESTESIEAEIFLTNSESLFE